MSLFATFGRPEFLRAFHGWATLAWFAASLPLAIAYGSSVIFVTFLSLYAIVTGHWSAWQSARVEVAQEEQQQGASSPEFERALDVLAAPSADRCTQCGKPFGARACGPTHAIIGHRLAAGKPAA